MYEAVTRRFLMHICAMAERDDKGSRLRRFQDGQALLTMRSTHLTRTSTSSSS